MIFDYEIQRMPGFGFDRRVSGLAKDTLIEIGQQCFEAVATLACEQIGGFAAIDQIALE